MLDSIPVLDPLSFIIGAIFGALVAWGLVWRTVRNARRNPTRMRVNELLRRDW